MLKVNFGNTDPHKNLPKGVGKIFQFVLIWLLVIKESKTKTKKQTNPGIRQAVTMAPTKGHNVT